MPVRPPSIHIHHLICLLTYHPSCLLNTLPLPINITEEASHISIRDIGLIIGQSIVITIPIIMIGIGIMTSGSRSVMVVIESE